MKIAYLDCFSGIAGDMFLAALSDGRLIDSRWLSERLSTLGLGRVRVRAQRVQRGGLSCTQIQFESRPEAQEKRHWSQIKALLEGSSLSASEKLRAVAIFQSLAEVEARLHGLSVDDVHFHELGAVDSILDIVGAALCLESLQIERWYASLINVGSGTIETAHGRLPVPAPATIELLKNFPVYSSGIESELVTPTGAAILNHLVPDFTLPPARWQSIGYGAGTKDFSVQPNLLRLLVGESAARSLSDEAMVIETEIDDMNPEFFPYVQQKLLQQGAKSVSAQNILMKKGRPGMKVRVLCDASQIDRLCATLFRETTTLGAVYYPAQRKKLARQITEVETRYGKVRVKLGLLGAEVVNIAPEYEDCKKLAEEKGVALKEIYRAATEAAGRYACSLPSPSYRV